MSKQQQFDALSAQLRRFTASPLYQFRADNNYYPVLGDGSLEADIMFIGEAPGKNEAERGKPFCGAAGRFLDKLIGSISLDRNDVFITSILHDRPPDNRDPAPGEIAAYTPFLKELIRIIEPRILVPLGRYAAQFIIERYATQAPANLAISSIHGTIIDGNDGLLICPLYHPAAALYNGSMRAILMQDMQALHSILKDHS